MATPPELPPQPRIDFPGGRNQGFQLGYNSGTVTNYYQGEPSASHSPPDPRKFWNVPFRRNPDFVNQGDFLSVIEQRLAEPAARFALTGLGGIGKSQLAIEYSYRLREVSPDMFIFWVHASTVARFEESYKNIAVQLKLSRREDLTEERDVLQQVNDWLVDGKNGRWTLILDNADDPAVLFSQYRPHEPEGSTSIQTPKRELATFLPQSPNGRILITSRYREVADRLVGHRARDMQEMQPMTQGTALALLQKKMEILPEDEQSALELLKALDFVPLAIEQASAYINQRKPWRTISSYLEHFQTGGNALPSILKHDPASLCRDTAASNSIFSTWKTSWDYIKVSRPSAARLLSLMSFFNCQGIPDFLLRKHRNAYVYEHGESEWCLSRIKAVGPAAAEQCPQTKQMKAEPVLREDFSRHRNNHSPTSQTQEKDSELYKDHKSCNHTRWNDPEEFEADAMMLRNFSLISLDADGSTFQMHPLVQLATQKWLDHDDTKTWKYRTLHILAAEFPPTPAYEYWGLCKTLLPHVDVDYEAPKSPQALKDWAQLLTAVACYADSQGNFYLAATASRKVLSLVKRDGRGLFHNEVASGCIRSLSWILGTIGASEEAEPLLRELMKHEQETVGEGDREVIWTMHFSGLNLEFLGRLDEAEELLRKSVELAEAHFGHDHLPEIAAIRSNFAAFLQAKRGKCDESKVLLSAVVEDSTRLLGRRHPTSLRVMINLASALGLCQEWEESQLLLQEVIEEFKEVLGDRHVETLEAVANLAWTYESVGRFEDAEALYYEVQQGYEMLFGKGHKRTVKIRNRLIKVLRAQRKWDALADVDSSLTSKDCFRKEVASGG